MPDKPQSFRRWAILPDDHEDPSTTWTAVCGKCDWRMTRPSYQSARTATMYHYYVCPKRWEAFTDDDA